MSILNINKKKNQRLGKLAEKLAEKYLKEGGFMILEKNYRKPWGEIDIIAKIGDTIVFVEVKANSRDFEADDFSPETRVNREKISKILKTAQTYLAKNSEVDWRVDIVAVTFSAEEKTAKIIHFENIAENIF